MAYTPNPQDLKGGRPETRVVDNDVQSLLGRILLELKKMNLYLSLQNDTSFTNVDVEI